VCGITDLVVELLAHLTRNRIDLKPDVDCERIIDNPITRVVKLADIADNPTRVGHYLLVT